MRRVGIRIKGDRPLVDVVIVEGRRDMRALKSLGVVKPLFTCSSPRRSHHDFVEEIAGDFRRVIVLTDFDEEGRDLNRELAGMLEQRGLIVAGDYRWYRNYCRYYL